jgi:hypothetical protein
MWPEVFNLPLYAAHVSGRGRWLLRAPSDDPFLPATVAVAAVEVPDFCGHPKWSGDVIRSFRGSDPRKPQPSGDIVWPRNQLLEVARLLDRLEPPSSTYPDRYFEQKSAIAHQLRRLARWRPQ